MRKPWAVSLYLLLSIAAASGTQREGSPGDQYLGTWAGTWEMPGVSSGGFELTLEKNTEGAMSGRVSVTGDPTYKAVLKTLSFDGAKLAARYDFPPDERAEVHLAATFDGSSASGSWSLREKANSGTEVASGTWKVKKKAS